MAGITHAAQIDEGPDEPLMRYCADVRVLHSLRQQAVGPLVQEVSSAAVQQVPSAAKRDLTRRTKRRRRLDN